MSFFQNFYALLLTSVTFNVTANILLKKGVLSFGGLSGNLTKLFIEISKAAANPFILIGLGLYGLSFLIWLRVLTFNDLSRAYPIFATIVFMFTTIGSIKFLNEDISILRIVGIAVMLLGIFIVARS
ncbi:MAG: hypothetical protein UU05_C0001G0087 [Candidatus Curtissbacteria bacterium GW2011_GWA1_40_47]|uniref:EamA domain-containing protein n=1 Tax=Candidatus Curtissbacteria bacterium RIFOXYA1_FULL_41_14 TaxID=1797737 RepID=A0A1F5HAP5_9BACT|nr:MAG: hypothetical protein UU05_C0001G0087 [Candidatus Curtissbacteria bacterium GW2011_GWA1_40_47]OGD79268.1 MAG: hypothetical protein A2683_04240 [Candidatus Curtissbacteria bacterium RIFCSPHIGHO2_01_FULL_34_40]OGE01244.1 MAG: hypothetical protein A2196_00860 [Candidatus Curtissbacteria bacterium RIFOXYA1_FULL_41_14]OGE04211.1 MAG: hypothetical protein A2362_01375 [Candidatus Curtissbacteria bacterium RIFOXYB1_FULL_41_59]OGE06932.1 MAG: hypothetical protein A2615_02055 [Candidatus Curtissba